ncbi:hypothetical protein HYV84_06525 [Candidatus Woesearchaeota archaeon]|nr:hypothetical protein [Candidatus Woesearchaeota archaeon]
MLAVFAAAFLYLALGEPWEHTIKHAHPYSYLASDAYLHQAMAQYAKDSGRVKFAAPYSIGGYEESMDMHPPMLSQISASLSLMTGIEVYDITMFSAASALLLAMLAAYFIWRRGSKAIALIALPTMLFMLTGRLPALTYWGYWLLLHGVMLLLAFFWALTHWEKKGMPFVAGVLLSAIALTHQPEMVFAGVFFAGFLVLKIWGEKSWKERKAAIVMVKKIAAVGIIFGILSFYSLLIFSKTYLLSEGYRNAWDPEELRGGYPVFNLGDLGLFGIIAILGVAGFFLMKKEKLWKPASVSLYCFILGFSIFFGLGKRGYAHRLFWFIYLSFFFGLAVYAALRIFLKNIHGAIPFGIAIFLMVLIVPKIYGNTKIGPGSMNPYDWEALQWIGRNIPPEGYVYYFYSDALSHNAPIYSSKRIGFNIRLQEYIQAIQSGNIQEKYTFGLADGYTVYLHPLSPFSFCYYAHELKPRNGSLECLPTYQRYIKVSKEDEVKNLCDISYYYFDKQASQPVLAQYNMAIREVLLKNGWIKEIYSNPLVSILQNEKPGDDCVAQSA